MTRWLKDRDLLVAFWVSVLIALVVEYLVGV